MNFDNFGVNGMIKTTRIGILLMLTLLPATVAFSRGKGLPDNYLRTDGIYIRDHGGKGNIINLCGTNLGGWLLREGWMDPIGYDGNKGKGTMDDYVSRKLMISRFGEKYTDRLLDKYQKYYISSMDIEQINNVGMNLIRIPFYWKEILDTCGNVKPGAFKQLDWVIRQARRHNMYVVLDLHGCPGGQSDGYQTSGQLGGNQLWTNCLYQEWTLKIWQTLARRYRGNPTVMGYDLMNEPVADKNGKMTIVDMYDRIYKAVREIDPDHIIVMNGFYSLEYLKDPKLPGWENVVYEIHPYGADHREDPIVQKNFLESQLQYIGKYLKLWNIPIYVGEFCYWNHYDLWRRWTSTLTSAHIPWTTWSYKNTECSDVNNWGLYTCNGSELPNVREDSPKEIITKWKMFKTQHYVRNDSLINVFKDVCPSK